MRATSGHSENQRCRFLTPRPWRKPASRMSTDAELGQSSETVRGAHSGNDADSTETRHEIGVVARLASVSSVWRNPATMLKRWFGRMVLSRSWLTFLVMGLAFFVFGVGTYNIFMLLSANIDLIANYGWMALTDGAARQFVELIVSGYLSMAAYVVFKTCEYRLAHDLAGAGNKA
jgi:hypothetical protein